MSEYAIGLVSRKTGLSQDTLRYYEKIGLMGKVNRDAGGRRRYTDKDLSRLAFIQRAQSVNFSLQEIAVLLIFRDQPIGVKPEVLALTQKKYRQVHERIEHLQQLGTELELLLNLCRSESGDGCPILENLEESPG